MEQESHGFKPAPVAGLTSVRRFDEIAFNQSNHPMKTNMIRAKVSVSTAAFIAAFVLITAPVSAEDLNAVFQQGRAAFYRNDYATA
ncbi:hypothetical protein [Prosthecobacter sp.]|uniref:hypothetical protein n=1 Tax=Prosthecobacter sp. TaxID=1965333 RepID=UPI001D9F044E|nr:hypothetical protein [Prosthecobacter sp.]MCB1276083.1 hypothetical protein [Prosthecobacter sp.]